MSYLFKMVAEEIRTFKDIDFFPPHPEEHLRFRALGLSRVVELKDEIAMHVLQPEDYSHKVIELNNEKLEQIRKEREKALEDEKKA